MTLKCLECENYARWHVWYKGCISPVGLPFPPANIAYNSFCDEHMIAEVKNGRKGWQVVCIKLVEDYLLPDDDRAKAPIRGASTIALEEPTS